MRNNLTRAAGATLIAACLTFTAAGQASAATDQPAQASAEAVAQFEKSLADAPADLQDEVAKYQALTDEQKAELVAVVLSGDFDAPNVEIVETAATDTVQAKPTGLAGRGGSGLGGGKSGSTLDFKVYDVTSTWTLKVYVAGVEIGYFRQVYKYQTGNNIVQKDYSCSGTYTGFAGFWNVSKSDSHWVSGGRGYCDTNFNLSVVYKGSAFQMNKRMSIVVGGSGTISKSMVNI